MDSICRTNPDSTDTPSSPCFSRRIRDHGFCNVLPRHIFCSIGTQGSPVTHIRYDSSDELALDRRRLAARVVRSAGVVWYCWGVCRFWSRMALLAWPELYLSRQSRSVVPIGIGPYDRDHCREQT